MLQKSRCCAKIAQVGNFCKLLIAARRRADAGTVLMRDYTGVQKGKRGGIGNRLVQYRAQIARPPQIVSLTGRNFPGECSLDKVPFMRSADFETKCGCR